MGSNPTSTASQPVILEKKNDFISLILYILLCKTEGNKHPPLQYCCEDLQIQQIVIETQWWQVLSQSYRKGWQLSLYPYEIYLQVGVKTKDQETKKECDFGQ